MKCGLSIYYEKILLSNFKGSGSDHLYNRYLWQVIRLARFWLNEEFNETHIVWKRLFEKLIKSLNSHLKNYIGN